MIADFLDDNLTLILVVLAVIFMAVIGYFAEKAMMKNQSQNTVPIKKEVEPQPEIEDADDKIIENDKPEEKTEEKPKKEEKEKESKKEKTQLDKTEAIDVEEINEQKQDETENEDVWKF